MIRFSRKLFTLFAVVACTVGTGCVAGVEDDPELLEAEQAVWIDEELDDDLLEVEMHPHVWQTTPVLDERHGGAPNQLAAMDSEADDGGTDDDSSNPEPTPWHGAESNPEPTPWHGNGADEEGSNPEPTPWEDDGRGDEDGDDEGGLDTSNGFMADTTTTQQSWAHWL